MCRFAISVLITEAPLWGRAGDSWGGRESLIIPHDVNFDLNTRCPLIPVAKINDFPSRYPVSSDLNITNTIIFSQNIP